MIQGAQNFNEIVTSNIDKQEKETKRKQTKQKAPSRSESDSKMPVEQLTSHVLSGGHHPTTHQAVNALLLLLALITIFGNRQ